MRGDQWRNKLGVGRVFRYHGGRVWFAPRQHQCSKPAESTRVRRATSARGTLRPTHPRDPVREIFMNSYSRDRWQPQQRNR